MSNLTKKTYFSKGFQLFRMSFSVEYTLTGPYFNGADA